MSGSLAWNAFDAVLSKIAQFIVIGQGSLACCSLWGQKESDTTEGLNDKQQQQHITYYLCMHAQSLSHV